MKALLLTAPGVLGLADVPEPIAGEDDVNRLFLSYRRADTAHVVGRIYDQLVADFGRESIFKDVDSIPFGVDFRKALEEALASCSVVLVVIGRDWCSALNEDGSKRLQDPEDFVRLEIESALRLGVRIIPVLIDDATMPQADDLPESLRELVFRNATVIRPDPDFHDDVRRLVRSIGSSAMDSASVLPSHAPRAANLHPAVQSTYQLRVTSGQDAGKIILIDRARMIIGRSLDCDICLREPMCSRMHCAIVLLLPSVWALEALHTSGVVLNDVLIRGRVNLTVGDQLGIGATAITFQRS